MRTAKPRPNGAPITILDIAQKAGVSVSTVSRVLSKTVPVARAKRLAVLDAVQTLAYRPNVVAQELASGHTRAIGVLPQGIANPFFSRIINGVVQGLRGTPYHPVFASGERPEEEAQACEMLLSHQVEALILVGGQFPDAGLVGLSRSLPLVAIGRDVRGLESRCVRVENMDGGYQATRHLIGLGHTRIAHLTGIPSHSDAIARREGYEKALAEAAIARDPELVVEGDFEERSGLEGVEKLIASGVRFTALFTGNDQMAIGAYLALFRHRLRVPQDVSVVGFDDQPSAAYTCPPLTTIRQPAVEMGMEAARALVAELRGSAFVQPRFAAELVRRESTGGARAA